MYDPVDIANTFIQLADERGVTVSNLKVQKLMYFAHARLLALHGEPLVNEEFQAFPYGPVIWAVYKELKHYGPSAIKEPIQVDKVAQIDPQSMRAIKWSFDTFGSIHPLKLSDMTHREGAPWRQTKKKGGRIPNDVIETYYEERWVEETEAVMQQLAQDPEFQEGVRRGIVRIESGEGVCYTEDELEEIIESYAQD